MLEFKTPLLAVALSAHDDNRRKKSDHVKISAELLGIPDLTVLGFEEFTTTWLGVDFG
jgi:hypothetical protein